jgi:ABC-type phosphate transport system substrate-binding protein
MALIAPSALADPPAGQFRALAGTGSDTTQDVLNALSNVIPDIGSYDATPIGSTITTKGPGFPSPTPPPPDPGGCTFTRPSGSTNGVRALVRERARVAVVGGQPCLDFARSSADTSQSPEFNGAGLTYIPFATDSVMYVTRSDSTISVNLTTAQLRTIYTDNSTGPGDPCLAAFRPLLPQPGSGTRAFFLQSIGVNEVGGAAPSVGNCVSDRDPTNPAVGLLENNGTLLTDPRNIAPYSVAQYVAQFTGTVANLVGATLKRNANGIPPVVRNPAAMTVTYTTSAASTISRNLTAAQLATIYTRSAPCLAQFQPLLPPAGTATRAAFLAKIGITEAQVGNCVTTVNVENDGRVLTNGTQIYPYDIDTYLDQLRKVLPDLRGSAVTRNLNGIFPHILNTLASFIRAVFNVVPTSKLGVPPTSTTFVGPGSAVCTNSAIIIRFGFATRPDCGDTSRQTPGGPSLP